jgi:ABC-type arginine transport system ATPase subunit
MPKRQQQRQPIVEDGQKLDDIKQVRRRTGPQMKMCLDMYNQQYPNKTLFWINDLDGDINRWIDAGAEPVPAKVQGRKEYAGLTDKSDSQWLRVVGGESSGRVYYAYALMMDPEVYQEYKIDPQIQRQAEIKEAMGSDLSGERTGGGVGYNQVRSK